MIIEKTSSLSIQLSVCSDVVTVSQTAELHSQRNGFSLLRRADEFILSGDVLVEPHTL